MSSNNTRPRDSKGRFMKAIKSLFGGSSSSKSNIFRGVVVRNDWDKNQWCYLEAGSNTKPAGHFTNGILRNVRFESSSKYDNTGCGNAVGVAIGDLEIVDHHVDSETATELAYYKFSKNFKVENTPVDSADVVYLGAEHKSWVEGARTSSGDSIRPTQKASVSEATPEATRRTSSLTRRSC